MGRVKAAERRLAQEAIQANPFLSLDKICALSSLSEFTVLSIARSLKEEGFDLQLERKIRVAEYFERRPFATVADAADFFGVSKRRIGRYVSSARVLTASESAEEKFNREMESRRCVRPTWYVVEIAERGCMGVELPEEEFQTYLRYYERRKEGWRPKWEAHRE